VLLGTEIREYDGLLFFLIKNVPPKLNSPLFGLFKNHSFLEFRKGRAIAIKFTTILLVDGE
jgi:hypothetical protein